MLSPWTEEVQSSVKIKRMFEYNEWAGGSQCVNTIIILMVPTTRIWWAKQLKCSAPGGHMCKHHKEETAMLVECVSTTVNVQALQHPWSLQQQELIKSRLEWCTWKKEKVYFAIVSVFLISGVCFQAVLKRPGSLTDGSCWGSPQLHLAVMGWEVPQRTLQSLEDQIVWRQYNIESGAWQFWALTAVLFPDYKIPSKVTLV